MRKADITWNELESTNFSANPIPSGFPYKRQMYKGKAFPITKAQALFFVKMGCLLSELNSEDVRVIELLMNKHGLAGNYRYSHNGMVKLINASELDKALRLEYNFN